MEIYKYIYSKEVMESFYNEVLSGDCALKPYELWYVCASARNKELNSEERAASGISNAEMYKSELVKKNGFEWYYSRICRFECNVEGYLSKQSNVPFPQKTLALYATVNPISVKKAFMLRLKQEQELVETMMNSAVTSDIGIINGLHKMLGVSNAISTKAVSRRNWLDYDVDLLEPFKISDICEILNKELRDINPPDKNRKYVIVKTKSGFHLLVSTKDLNFNPTKFHSILNNGFSRYAKEIEKTNSDSVPLPGTIQRDFEVNFKVFKS